MGRLTQQQFQDRYLDGMRLTPGQWVMVQEVLEAEGKRVYLLSGRKSGMTTVRRALSRYFNDRSIEEGILRDRNPQVG
jgi:hypothetical protein